MSESPESSKSGPASRITRARGLRRSSTFPERLLWSRLRDQQLGFKFRRQQPIAGFVTDFFCAERGLIVELDGMSHIGRAQKDSERQSVLESEGYRVIRVTNDDVLQRLGAVADFIRRECESCPERAETPHPSTPQSRR